MIHDLLRKRNSLSLLPKASFLSYHDQDLLYVYLLLIREYRTPVILHQLLLQHLLLSHHGEPDFGAAVRPMCAEAELLSYIDLIDSRMEIYAETLPGVPAGGFSQRIFALEKKIYHHN